MAEGPVVRGLALSRAVGTSRVSAKFEGIVCPLSPASRSDSASDSLSSYSSFAPQKASSHTP